MKTKVCSPLGYRKALYKALRFIGANCSLLTTSQCLDYNDACARYINFIPPVIYSDIETLQEMIALSELVRKRAAEINFPLF